MAGSPNLQQQRWFLSAAWFSFVRCDQNLNKDPTSTRISEQNQNHKGENSNHDMNSFSDEHLLNPLDQKYQMNSGAVVRAATCNGSTVNDDKITNC